MRSPFTIAGGSDLPAVHVDAIKMAGSTLGSSFRMKGSIRLKDGAGGIVPGATVTVELTFPSGAVRTKEAVTNARGIAQVIWASKTGGTWQACVLDVQHPGYVYDSDQNVETCDSLVYP